MILPTKHISTSISLIGLGAVILGWLTRPMTVTALWDNFKENSDSQSYHRFILALDLLYMIGAIDLDNGLIRRAVK